MTYRAWRATADAAVLVDCFFDWIAVDFKKVSDEPRVVLGPPWRVLIVDDDHFQHTYLKGILADMGILDVMAVDSGPQALEKIRGRAGFNLMLLDLMMPDMDGFEFMESAERLGFQGGLIIVSGQDDVVRYGATLVARMRKFRLLGEIQKPAERNALATMLAAAR